MSCKEWKNVKLQDVILFNPTESIKKGEIAKKIGMDKLETFQRKIAGYELTEFKSGTKFRNGDTLMARITPCLENGKTAQVSLLDEDEIAFGSTEFIVMRQMEGYTINDFVYYLSISPEIRDIAIKSMTGTSGRQRAQIDVIKNTIVNIPSIEEQQAIANILSSLDEKIETNNEINNKLEETAQAIFKRWFVDFEFPNEDDEPYKSSGGAMVESELGMIPEGWGVGNIGNYVKVKSGFAFKSAWWKNEGIPVIKIKDIEYNTVNFDNVSYVDKDKIELAKEFKVFEGDLVIAMTGATIGKFGIVPKTNSEVLVNQRVGKFFLGQKPFEKLGFIYGLLNQQNIYDEIVSRGSGSAQPNISPTGIHSIKIILPPDKIIERYNRMVLNILKQITTYTYENIKLSEVRNILLPKLMSGEIRVPVEE